MFFVLFKGAIQGPSEFAEGVMLGVRSLFGHTVGGAAGAVGRITGAMGTYEYIEIWRCFDIRHSRKGTAVCVWKYLRILRCLYRKRHRRLDFRRRLSKEEASKVSSTATKFGRWWPRFDNGRICFVF